MSLKEIAHRAGTSVSTVSRVLNQPDYKCKNPELEARIWAAAQEISSPSYPSNVVPSYENFTNFPFGDSPKIG